MRLWLLHAQSFHEPAVLLRRDLTGFLAVPWPLILPIFKPLLQQNEAVSFPVQRLDSVLLPPAEQKERIRTGIQLKPLLHQRSEAVYPFADIRVAAGDIHMRSPCEVVQHDDSARNSADRVDSSAPAYTCTFMPEISSEAATEETG